MIRALSLAAALALLPLAAQAQTQSPADPEAAIEAAAEVFEARMEEFGERAEAIAEDESLTEDQRETAIAALWSEYQPHVDAFTGVVSANADLIAAQALAEVDLDALVSEALAGVDVEAIVAESMAGVDVDAIVAEALAGVDMDVMAMAGGLASNGAWATNDPEHMATYGLMADYALGQVEGLDAEMAAIEAELATVDAELAALAAAEAAAEAAGEAEEAAED